MSLNEQDAVVDDGERSLLRELLEYHRNRPALPQMVPFRAAHSMDRKRLDRLLKAGLIAYWSNFYYLTLRGLRACDSAEARVAYERCRELLGELKSAYIEFPQKGWELDELTQRLQRSSEEIARLATFLKELQPVGAALSFQTGFAERFHLHEFILDTELPEWSEEPAVEDETADEAAVRPQVEGIEISGYRIFDAFQASLGNPTVIVGPNGAGKSSLLDLLRFLSFAVETPLPPEIDPHSAGKRLFHAGGASELDLAIVVNMGAKQPLRYELTILGPLGAPRVVRERLTTSRPLSEGQSNPFILLDFSNGEGVVSDPRERGLKRPGWKISPNELALRRALDPTLRTISSFQRFVASWRFYGGFDVSAKAEVRRPALIEEGPILAEDGSNLSAVLFSLMAEDKGAWEEIETHLRSSIQGFTSLNVKPRGGKGMVMATWREEGVRDELTLADMSDGSLRLLCWLALSLSPNLPPLVCIDEPEIGLHPRALSTLAGLFKVAAVSTQLLIVTQSPYFLSQFSPNDIAVMCKNAGRVSLVRGATSQVLSREFSEWGGEALARMFVTEELEVLS